MATNLSSPAFPCVSSISYQGISMRDYFAAKALQALIASHPRDTLDTKEARSSYTDEAYEIADAMLRSRNNQREF